jgi:hypothetical protein
MKTTFFTIALFIVPALAHAQTFIPQVNSIQDAKDEYAICMFTRNQLARRYSECVGKLKLLGVLSPVFINREVQFFTEGEVLANFPTTLSGASQVVAACSQKRANAGLHMVACEAHPWLP